MPKADLQKNLKALRHRLEAQFGKHQYEAALGTSQQLDVLIHWVILIRTGKFSPALRGLSARRRRL